MARAQRTGGQVIAALLASAQLTARAARSRTGAKRWAPTAPRIAARAGLTVVEARHLLGQAREAGLVSLSGRRYTPTAHGLAVLAASVRG